MNTCFNLSGFNLTAYRLLQGLLVFCCLVTGTPAVAENTPVVVTATRVAQTADETLSSVTVITREEIERTQASSLSELLQGVAGINITSQGGAGKLTSLFMRGTNPGHVSVLVDGIRMGSVTSGTVAWEFLPLAQVERIEIVRGPNSALYGSEAIGGVIQIFTRRGDGPFRWGATATGGHDNTRELAANISGRKNNSWISASVSHEQTDGFDARQPVLEFGFSPLDQPDNDGYDNTSGSLRLGHRFANGSDIEFHSLHAEGNTEYDGSFTNEDDYVQQAVGLTLRTTPVDFWDLTVSIGRSLDERDSFHTSTPSDISTFDTERRTFSIQNDFSVRQDDVISIGFDYHDDMVDSTTTYNETSRDTKAVFVQYQGYTGKHSLLARIRPLDDEQFGHHTTGNVAWGYQLGEQSRLSVSYGTAYKAPTFNDLYFPDFPGFPPSSNPDLEPEESETLEVGLSGGGVSLDWDVRAFRTRIDNLILLDEFFTPANLSESKIDGVEATLSGTVLSWDGSISATWLDPKDENSGNTLPRRPDRSVRLDVDRQFGKAGIGATLIAQSSRFDDSANTINISGYGVMNLRGTWRLNSGLSLQGRIDNIFDREYQTVDSYNSAERGLFLALRYEMGN